MGKFFYDATGCSGITSTLVAVYRRPGCFGPTSNFTQRPGVIRCGSVHTLLWAYTSLPGVVAGSRNSPAPRDDAQHPFGSLVTPSIVWFEFGCMPVASYISDAP